MKDIPINEFVSIENEIYKCVKDSDAAECRMCDFQHSRHCSCVKCCTDEREDLTSVFFILYDNISEDTNHAS